VKAHRDDSGTLVIEHKPRWILALAVAAALALLIYGIVQAARLGPEHEDLWGSLVAAALFFFVGSWAGTLWTVTADRTTNALRWRKASPLGKQEGTIPATDIAAVTLTAQRSGSNQTRRRPRLALIIQRHNADAFRLSQHAAATPAAKANLAAIATLLRVELGLPEPNADATLIDRINAAPSRVAAINDIKQHLGVSLTHAKQLVDAARAREDHHNHPL